MLISYVLIFIGVMLAGGLVAFLVRKLVKAAMLSWADRLAGAALGLVAATLAAALLILPLVAYSPWGERVLRGSVLAPYVTVVADLANTLVPEGLSERYSEKIEQLRRYWRDEWFRRDEAEPQEV
jgi:membrane protein required for colicin V production